MTRVLHKHLVAASFALRLGKLGGMRLGKVQGKERGWVRPGTGEKEHDCLDGAVGSESRSDPRTSCARNAQSQETRSEGCEGKCVKKPSGPFKDSRICSHGGSLGPAGHGPLTWKHLQHISLGCCRGCDESQETEPRQGPQGLCAVTHPPLGAPFT